MERDTSVFDVGQYILQKKGPMTAMKLQKIVYYCQAWSLVWDEKPIFNEKIEAWANGPVVRELYETHRGQYTIKSLPNGNLDKLDQTQKETVNAVLEYYGDKPSQWLSDLTHMEEPWRITRGNIPDGERGDQEITHATMSEYYGSLLPS